MTSLDMAAPLLECVGISKAFGGVDVLKEISIGFAAGQVTALAGENGAGKSTLMKIISGQYRADAGIVRIEGEVHPSLDARGAHLAGVAIVPQELAPVPDMTVYENLFLGRELTTAIGFLDRKAMIAKARQWLADFELDVDPRQPMRLLTVAKQQIVEIIKNTFAGCRVLLLDEPTSAISSKEVVQLYSVVRRLKDDGVAVLYTTHKMEEIRALADRVIVLRDGGLVADCPTAEITDDEIVTAMVGRELEELFPTLAPGPNGAPVLTVTGVSVEDADPVSFEVRPGEIVGLAGLVGAGRTELLEGLHGVRRRTGSVRVDGRVVRPNSPADAIVTAMVLVPEDRQRAGLVTSMSIRDNGILPHLDLFSSGGWLRNKLINSGVKAAMEAMRLKSRGLDQLAGTLSGGNQQKIVLGRWLTTDVKVLLLDEPTRGVDVGARSEIYRNIVELARQGMAVVMASSDLPEVLGLCHRALVLRGGTIAAELDRDTLARTDAQDRIFRIAAGMAADQPAANPDTRITEDRTHP